MEDFKMKKQENLTGLAQEIWTEYALKNAKYDLAINDLLFAIVNEYKTPYYSDDIYLTIEKLPYEAHEKFIKAAFALNL